MNFNKKLLLISVFLISSLISSSFAQSNETEPVYSKQCNETLEMVQNSAELGNCFPPIDLRDLGDDGLLSSEMQKNYTVDFDAYCSASKCEATFLDEMSNLLKTNCSEELAANTSEIQFIVDLIAYNPMIYDIACLKDANNNNSYCYLQLNHSVAKRQYFAYAENNSKEQLCTACNKAIANTIVNFQNNHTEIKTQFINSTDKEAIENKCDKSFFGNYRYYYYFDYCCVFVVFVGFN